jgi:hypothetical protein
MACLVSPLTLTGREAEVSDRLNRAIASYNEVWQAWKDLTTANVDECREEAMCAALRAADEFEYEQLRDSSGFTPEFRARVAAGLEP